MLRTVRGLGWAAFSQFGRHGLQLGSVVVLARLLSPQDFGVMSLATVVTGFIALFRDMGTGAALIQRDAVNTALVSSLFSLNALLGTMAGLLAAAAAPFAASFFHAPDLQPVMRALAVSVAVAGLGVVPQAVMERDGRFDTLARIELVSMATGVTVAIAMAYRGYGIWSLVGQTLVTTLLGTALLTIASAARPTLWPDWALLRSVAGYSANLGAFNVFNYFVRNADNFIIGKVIGAQELGYYALAYQIAIGPVRSIGGVVGRVLFPALSRLQNDRSALGKAYLQGVRLMVWVCFPLMALLAGLANVATVGLLGESWQPMAPVLAVLALVGFVQSASVTIGTLYMTTGRTDLLMRWGLGTGVLAIVAFWVGANWSALGVAVAYGVVMCVITYPCFRIPFRLVDLRVAEVWQLARRPGIASLMGGLVAYSIARETQPAIGATGALIAGASFGIAAHIFCAAVGSGAPLKMATFDGSRIERSSGPRQAGRRPM